jgi:hypothetical protein
LIEVYRLPGPSNDCFWREAASELFEIDGIGNGKAIGDGIVKPELVAKAYLAKGNWPENEYSQPLARTTEPVGGSGVILIAGADFLRPTLVLAPNSTEEGVSAGGSFVFCVAGVFGLRRRIWQVDSLIVSIGVQVPSMVRAEHVETGRIFRGRAVSR